MARPTAAHPAELVIRIPGLNEPLSQVCCSLFAGPAGLPMDNDMARVLWQATDNNGVTWRCSDVAERSYAVSIGCDMKGNQAVDANFVGPPTEQWRASNSTRPSLRAPRFDEAAFEIVADAKQAVIDIRGAK